MKSTPKIRGFIAEKDFSAVFLYRRSNKITYLLQFSYKNRQDKLTVGSKFIGKLYPNRSSVSPDGRYFIYFAMGAGRKGYEKKFYTWTAICEPPKITALYLLAHTETYSGGGYFIDEKNIYLAAGVYSEFENTLSPGSLKKFGNYEITFDSKFSSGGWDSPGSGWRVTAKNKHGFATAWIKESKHFSVSKSVKKNWINDGEFSMHDYKILCGEEVLLPEENITWADIDNYGRLITAVGSRLLIYKDKSAVKKNGFAVIDIESYIE